MAGITATSLVLALRLDPEFDVKDLFDNNSDFVVGLDKLDEHIAERSGEPGIIYIQGDLTDPQSLAAMHQFVGKLANNPYVGRNDDGVPKLGPVHTKQPEFDTIQVWKLQKLSTNA